MYIYRFLCLAGASLAAQVKVYTHVRDLPKVTFDFIIAGGGIAGSVLAGRLTEVPTFKVLLIEAGPDNDGALALRIPANSGGQNGGISRDLYMWNYTLTPQAGLNNRTWFYPRGRVLGGSSSVNTMIYSRGAKDDYDLWAKVTKDKAWSWKNMWQYALKNEGWSGAVGGRNITGQFDPRAHATGGSLKVALPWREPIEFDQMCIQRVEESKEWKYNMEPNDGNSIGLTWLQSTYGGGERSSAATAYLPRAVRERPNLTILVNTYVTRVVPVNSLEQLDIRTVEVASEIGGKRTRITASKEVILSGGTIGSAHILLNSGIGDREELTQVGVRTVVHLPDVGKGLSDHTNTGRMQAPANGELDPPVYDLDEAMRQWETNKTGPLTESPIKNLRLWTRIPANSKIIQKYGDPSSGPSAPHLQLNLQGSGSVAGGSVCLLQPHSRGSIKLQSSDPFDNPLIDLGLLTHPFDIEAVKEGYQTLKRFFSGPIWQDYFTGSFVPDIDTLSEADFEYEVRNMMLSALHPVGTAAMSALSSDKGVVDPELRVKKVRNLRVVDASVIPYVPSAHTQAPVYILAERAADVIRSAWT